MKFSDLLFLSVAFSTNSNILATVDCPYSFSTSILITPDKTHSCEIEIKDINKDVNILLVGCYNIYGDMELTASLNEAIKEVANENCYFIDIGGNYV